MLDILPIIIVSIAGVGLAAYFLLTSRSGGVYVATEEGETKPSEYRTAQVTYLVTLIHYWLPEFCMTQPTVYSTDDCTETYIEQNLINGLLTVQVNWSRQRIYCYYALHEGNTNVCRELRTSARLRHDKPLVKFLHKVVKEELSLYAPSIECVKSISETAQLQEVAQNIAGDDFKPGSEFLAMMLGVGAVLLNQRRPDPLLATMYMRLIAILREQYPEEYKSFIESSTAEKD